MDNPIKKFNKIYKERNKKFIQGCQKYKEVMPNLRAYIKSKDGKLIGVKR